MTQLRPYQQAMMTAIRAAWVTLAVGVALAPTGAGKTLLIADAITQHRGASCLIAHRGNLVAQLSMTLARCGIRHRLICSAKDQRIIAQMHVAEFGVSYVDPGSRCAVASAQTLARRTADLATWASTVTLWIVDECFPAGTLVDGRPIETLRIGDEVTAFDERTGRFARKKIVHVFKNPAPNDMVQLKHSTHHVIHCTTNHPFWTKRGWVNAIHLTTEDEIFYAADTNDLLSMRGTGGPDEALPEKASRNGATRVLRDDLLDRVQTSGVVGNGVSNESQVRVRPDESAQSDGAGRNTSEGVQHAQRAGQPTQGSWREREAVAAGGTDVGDAVRGVGLLGASGRAHETAEGVRLPDVLQTGLRQPCLETGVGGGRDVPYSTESAGAGRQEGRAPRWVRLDSVKVYERDDPDAPRSSSDDGFVYNFDVEDFHTYTANGVVVHNCHHLVRDNMWAKCIEMFTHPDCKGLGPTATPKRADGKGLGRHASGYADFMVALVDEDDDTLGVRLVLPGQSVTCAPSRLLGGYATHSATPDPRMGYLTPYRVYGAESHLVEFLGEVAESGDWSVAAQKRASQQSAIVGDVVTSYRQHAWGKIGITFTTDVDTAADMAAAYRAGGVPAEVLTGETDPTVRRAIFERLAKREILQVVAVDVISEGTDIPAIEVVTMARPTASVSVFLQQLGRGLRVMLGKSVTILIDHVGNFLRHRGGPDTPRTWSLDDADRKASGPSDAEKMRYCVEPTCAEPYAAFLHCCPYCGSEPPAPAARSTPDMVEGDMVLLDPAVLAQLRGEIPDDLETERARLTATGLPARFVTHNLKAHMSRLEELAALRVAMAAWGGWQRAAGLDDRDIQRLFFARFGVDVLSALALSAGDARALRERVDASVTVG